jgi:hypothetical protein
MKTIWVICGSTGHGDDRQKWIVQACATRLEATLRIAELHRLLGEMATEDGRWSYDLRRAREDAMRAHPRGDAGCWIQSTGTRYEAVECPMPAAEFMVDGRFFVLAFSTLLYAACVFAIVKFEPGRRLFEHFFR